MRFHIKLQVGLENRKLQHPEKEKGSKDDPLNLDYNKQSCQILTKHHKQHVSFIKLEHQGLIPKFLIYGGNSMSQQDIWFQFDVKCEIWNQVKLLNSCEYSPFFCFKRNNQNDMFGAA